MESVNEMHVAQSAWPCESFIHSANIYRLSHPTLGRQVCAREASAWPCGQGAPSLRKTPANRPHQPLGRAVCIYGRCPQDPA